MNESMDFANGKFILFLNSDDLLLKSTLKKVINLIENLILTI